MALKDLQSFKNAFQLSASYLIFGMSWIYFSDTTVASLASNTHQLTLLQNYKGWLFILITTFFLFLLSYRFLYQRFVEYSQQLAKQKKAQILIEQKNALLNSLINSSSDAIVIKGLDKKYFIVNEAAAQLSGLSIDEVIGKTADDIFPPQTANMINTLDNELLENKSFTDHEEIMVMPNGITRINWVTKGLLRTKNGELFGIYGIYRDISKAKENEQEILNAKEHFDYLAHHDPLTELPNRLSLIETLIVKTDKMDEHPFALLYIDLDGFKEINDSYGHRFGDKLLIHVALLLERIFPEDSFIVRTGGDEFVILLSCQKDQNLIHQTMQLMVDILNHPINIDDIDVYITASVGIAMYPNDAKTTEELLQHADAAMYNAKKMGKNTYSFYHTNLTEKALQRTTIGTNLKKALHNNGLTLHFQPQINPQDGSIIGAEALLRWFTPEGPIPPFTFIPIAEETGLILDIGKWVLEESFLTAKKWNESYGFQGRIAVNVSARQLIHPDFLMVTRELIEKTGCNPALIELEITESSILENPQRIIQLLKVLKEDGFHLSIDDFGTGYSSLSYLKNLPIDKLKIDISFVRNITMEPKNQTIVKTIIALANGLGMEVLAEGVETSDELQFLRQNHIDSIQGYYYHKPMSIENIELLFSAAT